jgi:hypothetical protein
MLNNISAPSTVTVVNLLQTEIKAIERNKMQCFDNTVNQIFNPHNNYAARKYIY